MFKLTTKCIRCQRKRPSIYSTCNVHLTDISLDAIIGEENEGGVWEIE